MQFPWSCFSPCLYSVFLRCMVCWYSWDRSLLGEWISVVIARYTWPMHLLVVMHLGAWRRVWMIQFCLLVLWVLPHLPRQPTGASHLIPSDGCQSGSLRDNLYPQIPIKVTFSRLDISGDVHFFPPERWIFWCFKKLICCQSATLKRHRIRKVSVLFSPMTMKVLLTSSMSVQKFLLDDSHGSSYPLY